MIQRLLIAAALVVALGLPCLATSPVRHRAGKATTKAVKVYWICKECGVYYTPAEASKRGYKCGMGHPLVKVSSIPKGFDSGPREGM